MIAVVLVHVNGCFVDNGAPSVLARMFGAGWLGVDVFFVLSGFLITSILLAAAGRDPHYFRNFYARRSLRIFPLYYAYVLAVTVLWPLVLHFEPFASAKQAAQPLLLYYINFWSVGRGAALMLVFHFWSLAVEEHFYLCWPLIVRALFQRLNRLAALCLGGVIAAPLIRWQLSASGHEALAPVATFSRCDGLFMGALVAVTIARLDQKQQIAKRKAAWALLIIVASATFGLALMQGHFYYHAAAAGVSPLLTLTAGISGVVISTGALVYLLATHCYPVPLLGNRLLGQVGRYSYGIYVYHVMAIFVVARLASRISPGWASRPEWIIKPTLLVVVFALSFVIAAVSYWYYERPFLRLKVRFEPPRPGGAAGTAATL